MGHERAKKNSAAKSRTLKCGSFGKGQSSPIKWTILLHCIGLMIQMAVSALLLGGLRSAERGIYAPSDRPDYSINRLIAGCFRFLTLYGAFLVKGKFPHMLLSCRVLRLVGFSGRFLPFLA
jgi:hypothetical protein